jgi:hypothetical protein
VPIRDGELGLVEGGRAQQVQHDRATKLRWLGMFNWIAAERGYKPSWAAVNYKQKFGAWPSNGIVVEPITPTAECRSWVRSRLIAYAKARGAA